MARGLLKRIGLAAALAALCLTAAGAARTQTDPTAGPLAVQNPRRIAAGPDGTLLVTDRRYGTIVAVDRTSLQPVWSAQLTAEGRPFGLGVRNRLVFVGNTGTKRVEVYRIKGSGGADTRLAYAHSLAQADGTPAVFEKPIGVGVDGGENLVFVLDGAAKSVGVFRRNGAFVRSFAPRGSDGTLLSPVSLAVDPLRKEILIGDFGDPRPTPDCSFCTYDPAAPARIMIFDYAGELLFEIRGDGTTHWATTFARVQGMAAGADGRIFAADPLGNRIFVFDRATGAVLQELGTEGSAPGQLMLPLDVWLDGETGDLFISNNRGARRIEVLRGAGGQP
jgi:DNA-binding beta-propeller fold protein YncE